MPFSPDVSDSFASRISTLRGPSISHLGQRKSPEVSDLPSNASRRVALPQCLHTWKCNRFESDSLGSVGIVLALSSWSTALHTKKVLPASLQPQNKCFAANNPVDTVPSRGADN